MLIYKLTNKLNGKCYIGQTTKSINERLAGHLRDVRGGSDCAIHRAIRKYSIDNFNIEILEDNVRDRESLSKLEVFYIAKYDSFGVNGYNMTDGGENPPIKKGNSHYLFGKHPSEESRKKMSEAHKGIYPSKETIKKRSITLKGIKRSDEWKNKIAKANKGKHHSEETKRKMSIAKQGIIPHNKGKHYSEETRKKMSLAKIGLFKGEKNPNFGKPMSEEQKLKISETKKRKNQIIKLTNILNKIVGA